jgi:hypothetical protein
MSLSRRDIILSLPAVPILARPVASEGVIVPTTVAQIVARLDELQDVTGAAATEAERDRLVQQLVRTPAVNSTEIRLRARVVGEHIVFPCPDDLCTADGLFRRLLLDLGVDA